METASCSSSNVGHLSQWVLCAADTKEYIRSSFAIHRDKEDLYDIKYALSDGREQLKRWREMLGLSCIGQKGEPARYSPSNTNH